LYSHWSSIYMLPSTGDFPFRLNVIIISLMLPSSFINWGWTGLLRIMVPFGRLKEF